MAAESPKIFSVNCNHCGAALEVGEETRFVTCSYCHSRLAVERTSSAIYTSVLEKIERNTVEIAGNLKLIELQNELSQLDREWGASRTNLMSSGRYGGSTAPSVVGGFLAIIIGVLFGGFWTVTASKMGAPGIFPLFGIFFIAFCVIAGVTTISKAGRLKTVQSDYESRRQELLGAIERERGRLQDSAPPKV